MKEVFLYKISFKGHTGELYMGSVFEMSKEDIFQSLKKKKHLQEVTQKVENSTVEDMIVEEWE